MVAASVVVAQNPSSSTDNLPVAVPSVVAKPSIEEAVSSVLSLTEAQQAELQPYFDAVQPRLDLIEEEARQAEDALIKQLLAQIQPLLTPEQQNKIQAVEQIPAEVDTLVPIASH